MLATIAFWVLIGILFYTYFGYTILLAITASIKGFAVKEPKTIQEISYRPNVTLLIAAYNEKEIIKEKIENTLNQDYPANKIHQIWITDGSTDGTPEILEQFKNITLLHQHQRQGKTAALNRAMAMINTPITIFSDANSMLSPQAISALVKPFANLKIGCVAGEKRIFMKDLDDATTSGEGLYWKYESLIKKLESDCGSTLSAAGELYAIRTELFSNVKDDAILDDFIISTAIVQKGYSIKYAPTAYATEKASVSIDEERKRKARIAAGSFQTLFRNLRLMNPFRYPFLSLQFFSHKILRWVALPISLVLIPILNIIIIALYNQNIIYIAALYAQLFILIAIICGWIFKDKQIAAKWIFLPYYLFMMNISIIQGFFRFLKGTQSVKWDKSLRQT